MPCTVLKTQEGTRLCRHNVLLTLRRYWCASDGNGSWHRVFPQGAHAEISHPRCLLKFLYNSRRYTVGGLVPPILCRISTKLRNNVPTDAFGRRQPWQRWFGALVCGRRRELENITWQRCVPSLLEHNTPNRRFQGQTAASGDGCLAVCAVLWLWESGNIIWWILLSVRVLQMCAKFLT